jgi:hypothetical protein
MLLDALNRYRGKGQQKVTVEHVHVHSGGRAIVGTVERTPPTNSSRSENQHDARQITHAPQPAMRSPNAEREAVPVARDAERPTRDAERPMSDARRTIPGSDAKPERGAGSGANGGCPFNSGNAALRSPSEARVPSAGFRVPSGFQPVCAIPLIGRAITYRTASILRPQLYPRCTWRRRRGSIGCLSN